MPEVNSKRISTAAHYLGISSHKLIQDAINEKVRNVYGAISIDAEAV